MRVGGQYRKRCRRSNDPWNAHELTFSCFHGQAFLARERTRQWLAMAVNQTRLTYAYDVWAYVIMPEHVHLVVWPREAEYLISKILKATKQSVGRRAADWLRRESPAGLARLATGQKSNPYRFWQDGGGYDRNIREPKALRGAIDYIHNNPVRRGLVERPGDWPWSSYREWTSDEAGLIPIDKESCNRSLV